MKLKFVSVRIEHREGHSTKVNIELESH